MELKLIFHKEEKYLEIITQGVADCEGSLNMAKIISETMKGNRITKVLIDHRNITGISGKTIEIYNRPNLTQFSAVALFFVWVVVGSSVSNLGL